MTLEFENWTEYDNWLIQNYDQFAMTDVAEINGKVKVEYIEKEQWLELQKKKPSSAETSAAVSN